jgi:hypothetical protein
MSSIEAVDPKNFNIQSQENQPALAVLQTLGVTSVGDKDEAAAISAINATLLVEDLPIPLIEKEALMKKIVLRLFWGPGVDEALEVIYLMPGTP